ncbi:MAG: class I SAM-dependent methyltransferase, partial [Candidatus Eiseniibacteriota bacterium]
PPARYDAVFFAFWLSHVPESRFDAFWRLVDRALRPGGRVFLVDSRYAPTSTARDHRLGPADAGRVTRRLDDGRSFEIVKMFHAPPALRARLAALGWEFEVGATAHYFIHAAGGRRPAAEA